MYEFSSRVRYSETDADGNMKWDALVNYLQDCSTFQSEDCGLGVRYLGGLSQAWVINYWQIDIKKLPVLAEHIIIGTIPYEIRGFFGFRNFYIKSQETGEIYVQANSVWTLIDLKNVRPMKVNAEMQAAFAIGEKLDMEYTDRKIVTPELGKAYEPIQVMPHHLDSNNHVNNGQYIALALNFLPQGATIRRIRTEYKKSAYLGDILIPMVQTEEECVTVSFVKEGENEPLVKCQFIF